LPANGPDNKTLLGNLAMAFMLSFMTLAPLFGWLAGRMPRWRLVGFGVILWSLASGASGLAGSINAWAGSGGCGAVFGTFGFLLLTRCCVGVGEAAYGPAAPDILSDLYPIRQRGRVLAWFYVAVPVGGALGYAVGGLAGWPTAFYLVVPPGLLLGLFCFFMPEPRRGQHDAPAAVPVRKAGIKDYLTFLRTPSYVLDTLGMAAMTFALGGIAHFMPDYVETFRGERDYVVAGTVVKPSVVFGLIVVVSGLVATLAGGWAGNRLRARFPGSYFLVSGAAMVVCFPLFVAVLYTPFPWDWIVIFLACFCLFFNIGPTNAILANVTHPALRAAGFALNIFLIHLLGDAASPTLIGMIADGNRLPDGRADMNAGFMAVSAAVLLGGLFWLAGVPFLARDTARAPQRLDA
jgi:MFS family permease